MLKTVFSERLSEKQLHTTPCVLVLGGFDGLHEGHKTLLEKAKTLALPVGVMTIVGGKDETALFTLTERRQSFSSFGADFCFAMSFEEIRSLSPVAFISLIQLEFTVSALVCGEDFRFGCGAKGKAEDLKTLVSVPVFIEPIKVMFGEKIGTTAIKKALACGDVSLAKTLLGEPFFLTGEVVKDRGVGRTMGFPTAYILYPQDKYPLKKGVYETEVCVEGISYRAITNYGARPTFQDEKTVTESYLDGFCGDLYGKTLTVRFVRFLREIKKFSSVEELKTQLLQDVRRIREHD